MTIPAGLRTDEPSGHDQILAWAIDQHEGGWNKPGEDPRWMIVQYASLFPGGPKYWNWSVPGRSTSIRILGWMPLPANDWFGERQIEQNLA